jgi:aconitate hydratase 2/2-methylisocitrate dehydratase
VNAIPWVAIQSGDLTVAKEGKKNVFSGRILEIEGLPKLKVEQAFELSDASAERSAAGCTIRLDPEPIVEYLRSNVVLLRWMVANGYQDARTLERRAAAMEEWIAHPELLAPDDNADYHKVLEVDMSAIREPLLACPNDPDDVRTLSEVAGTPIDEVFIGSCMTNIGHFRAAGKLLEAFGQPTPTRLWIAPPTTMDRAQLIEEGYYSLFAAAGARTELPGCSLCMGNQARVAEGASVVSTSTRNFPNRLGKDANVFLASAELAAVAAMLGKLPSVEEYLGYAGQIDTMAADVYRYLNFDELPEFVEAAEV